MIPGRDYTPQEVMRAIFIQRRWVVILPCVLATTVAIVLSSQLPDRYRAETLILAASQSVSQDLVRTSVTTQKEGDRLPSITQQILSRTRLERIIEDLNLYREERRTLPMEIVVQRMRDDIAVSGVWGSDSFRVSYESDDGLLATEVTERLAGLFIEENIANRKLMATETNDFLESQLENARLRLVEQEKRLEAYRLQYGSELPTQLNSNLQVIQNAQMQLQAVSDGLNRDRDRRLFAARQLANLQAETPTNIELASRESRNAAQLEAARAELRDAERRLTSQHPDLARAKQAVTDLERLAQLDTGASSHASPPQIASEVARLNRANEIQAEIESLDRQIAAKLQREEELRAMLETYQARVEAAPSRESDLISITRDYETLQDIYRSLLARKEESNIAAELEKRQVGEQFTILDPPRQPERPFTPNRPLIDLAGALGGLFLGTGLATLLEFRDKSVKNEADVRAALDLPVVVVIPEMLSRDDRQRARRRATRKALAIVAVLLSCGTVVFFTFRF